MPKLFYTPTSCGAASFIAAYIANVQLDAEQVDIRDHKTASGGDYLAINSKGNVPALLLDDGTLLNEGAAVLQYIADKNPGTIAPPSGAVDRYLVQNALNYVASEVHPSIGGLFNPTLGEDTRTFIKGNAAKKLTYLQEHLLKDKDYLVGNTLSIADLYLYIVLSWTGYVGVDLAPYPAVQAFSARVGGLEKVKEAHARIATNPATTI